MPRRLLGVLLALGLMAMSGADTAEGPQVLILAPGPYEIKGDTITFYSGLAQDKDIAVLDAHPEVTGVRFVATPMSIHFPGGGIGEGTSSFQISDEGFAHFATAKKLERLTLDARKPLVLSDKAFAALSGLNLKVVRLGATPVDAAGLKAIVSRSSLEEFSAYKCKAADVVDVLSECTRLRVIQFTPRSTLYFSSDVIFKEGKGPASPKADEIAKLAPLTELEEFYADDCLLTDEAMVTLVGFKKLRVLHLQGAKITDAGVARLGLLTGLEELNLNGTAITDAAMATIAMLPKLQTLYLTDTQVTDEGVKGIARMRGLLNVALRNTKVTKKGVALFYPGKVVDRNE